MNTTKPKEAYEDYLLDKSAIRFSEKGIYIPNMEVKIPEEFSALKNKLKVIVNEHVLYVSALESQIAFKIKLGSDKDYEDAVHLYEIFKNNLNMPLLKEYCRKFNIENKANELLRWKFQ